MIKIKSYDMIQPIDEARYAGIMTNTVEPQLKVMRHEGFFDGGIGKIHYEYYVMDGAKASIVLVHGFTEMAEKFREMMYYFLEAGYNVFALDHRGHGYSSRIKKAPNIAHVDSFDGYVTDLNEYIEKIVRPVSCRLPLYLYSHSMGGAISAMYMQRYPDVFEKAVLSSPMISAKTGAYSHTVTRCMTRLMRFLGKGATMVFTEKPFDPNRDCSDSGATSEARFSYTHNLRIAHKEYQSCGASYKWLDEAIRIVKIMLNQKNCNKISAKILLFQAENDSLVNSEPQEEFVSRVKTARIIKTVGTKHEIYLSSNDALERYLRDIFEFFAE